MRKLFQVILIAVSVLSVLMVSSCKKIEDEESYNIVGYWKFTGFNGKDYPDDYYYMHVTNDMIVVYDRHEKEVASFGYKRKDNTLTLTAPFAGEYTSILVDSASYNEQAKLGQMLWDCGSGQKYYFGIWDR